MALACRHRTVLTDSNALVARVGGQADRHVRLAWSVCVCVRACVRLWVGGWMDGLWPRWFTLTDYISARVPVWRDVLASWVRCRRCRQDDVRIAVAAA